MCDVSEAVKRFLANGGDIQQVDGFTEIAPLPLYTEPRRKRVPRLVRKPIKKPRDISLSSDYRVLVNIIKRAKDEGESLYSIATRLRRTVTFIKGCLDYHKIWYDPCHELTPEQIRSVDYIMAQGYAYDQAAKKLQMTEDQVRYARNLKWQDLLK